MNDNTNETPKKNSNLLDNIITIALTNVIVYEIRDWIAELGRSGWLVVVSILLIVRYAIIKLCISYIRRKMRARLLASTFLIPMPPIKCTLKPDRLDIEEFDYGKIRHKLSVLFRFDYIKIYELIFPHIHTLQQIFIVLFNILHEQIYLALSRNTRDRSRDYMQVVYPNKMLLAS